MRAVAIVLSCLACVEARQSAPNELQALATLLQAISPEAGWQVNGASSAMKGLSATRQQPRSAVAMNGQEDVLLPSRRHQMALAAAAGMASVLGALPAVADDDDEEKVKAPPLRNDGVLQSPDQYKLSRKYAQDTKLMVGNMKLVTDMGRGTQDMEAIAKATRKQMIDYIGLYRPRPETQKLPSFSVMYTAINTICGHYSSYGFKYPLPEKRRVRLAEQFNEIERALARGK